MEQLAIEASTLRSVIEKEVPTQYLGRKEHTNEKDIEQIKKFKEDVKSHQTTFLELL